MTLLHGSRECEQLRYYFDSSYRIFDEDYRRLIYNKSKTGSLN